MFRKVILLVILITSVHFSLDSRIVEKTENLRKKILISEGKEKISAYIDLIEYLSLNQPHKAFSEKDNILKLIDELNDKKSLARAYIILGECYAEIHKIDSALAFFEKGLEIAKSIADSIRIAEAFIKIGRMKITSGELDQSLRNFEDALAISERNKFIENQILAINYLGILNYILDNLEDAEKLSIKGLELAKKHNFLAGICLANEHLAIIRIKQENFSEAIKYNSLAEQITIQRDFIANLPAIYYNYAVIYNRLKEYDKAIEYLNKSREIRKSIDDIRGSASDYGMLGRIYLAKKEYAKAIENFSLAEKIYKEYNAIRPLISVLLGLANAYENVGNYKSALNYFKEYKIFNDSVYNENVRREFAISNVKRQLAEKEQEIRYLEELNIVKTKTQTYLLVFISIVLLLFFLTTFLYISVRKSRQNLAETNKKLVALNNERNKFFSIISHDLKSPFLGILGLIELLKDDINPSSNGNSKILIDKLETAVKNQFKLVENLLDWTRLQSGKMQFNPSNFNLNELIIEVINNLSNFASHKNVRIKANLVDNFSVWADRKMVFSIVMNILSNAIKYSHTDSDVIISTSKKDSEFISVKIKDSGVGISEENISKVFNLESNYSTEGTDKEKGTGLGLIIVKEMLLKNRGELSVSSRENIGSVFEFTLPIAES